VLGATLAACYAPNPQPGAPCASGVCPTGLVCSAATNTCERTATDASGPTIDARVIDAASIDGTGATSPDARTCYGSGLLSICPNVMPSAPLQITSNTSIDTQASSLCVAYTGTNAGAYCVLVGTSISVATNRSLSATGTRPLVLLSTSTVTIDGTVDVSGGAGANPTTCVAGGAPTGSQGGAGGSFTGRGGSGGGEVSGLGPTAAPATTTIAFHGGCPGGTGAGSTPGTGGSGGGAVYVIAASSITITGSINASGAPGTGAAVFAGGGGGGAGGFIGLDAPTVSSTGSVFANGGGGGEGATPRSTGLDGAASAGATAAASGGAGSAPHGGDGGAGSVGASRAGEDGQPGGQCGQNAQSGGGGGGAAGMIYVFPAQTLAGQVSPPQS